jgi:hypothetical protein
MNQSPVNVSPEEQEQLLQTIEMFEVIVQANPLDTQSIEILRDAYQRLGMWKESVGMSKRLAQTFTELKQYTAAVQEYEVILKHEPDNVEVIAAMGEVEEKMHKAGGGVVPAARPAPKGGAIDLDFRNAVADTGTLMATATTSKPDGFRRSGSIAAERVEEIVASMSDDGNEALAKFLVQHRLATEDAVSVAKEIVARKNQASGPEGMAASLIDEIVERGGGDLGAILSGILDRTKFAYIPLEYYDVDRQIARMLPENVALSRLMVPFDVMSRTVMIATANPFDSTGKNAAQQLLDYNIQWHLASPSAIIKVLQQAHKLSPGAPGVSMAFPTITPAAAAAAAAASAPVPAAAPLPAIKVAATSAPLTTAKDEPTAPLPDTSGFRLK